MADEKIENKPQENTAGTAADAGAKAETKKKSSILPWIIIAVIVLVATGAGLGLGRMLGKNKKAAVTEETTQPEAEKAPAAENSKPAGHGKAAESEKSKSEAPSAGTDGIWYYDLEPVVANLDEPGATRYVRVAFTLEMTGETEKGTAFLELKKPLLKNVLTIYLAGLNVDSTRGDKNLKRIQSEVCDMFNERLYPNAKPLIKGILIKEFAVQ